MGIRNSKELGSNLLIIAKQLLKNTRLCQLLVNSSKEPFNNTIENPLSLLHKNLLIVPQVHEEDFNSDSKIVVLFPEGEVANNDEFKKIYIDIMVYTLLDNWIVNDESLRPFLIMSEIEESLKNKRMNGVGVLTYNNFELTVLTDKISCYRMRFELNVFD